MMRLAFAVLLGWFAACAQAADAPAPMAPEARTIVLVRHGHYVPDPAADPTLEAGLTPLGVAQAKLAGARLAGWPMAFDARYVSPMQRARDTANAVAETMPGLPFQVVDDLAECTPPTRRRDIMDTLKRGEMAACQAQLDRVFATYFRPAQGKERTELFVAHGNVIRYLVTRALGVDTTSWLEMSVGHASITRIRVEADGRFKVIAVGDVGHLPTNMLTGATGDVDPGKGATPPAFDAGLAKRLGADERGMRPYVLVVLKTGPTRVPDGEQRDAMFRGHFANMERLAKEGKLVVAGPFSADPDQWRGLFLFAVADVEEAKRLTATDPVIVNGEMVAEFHRWYGSAAAMLIPETHDKLQPPAAAKP